MKKLDWKTNLMIVFGAIVFALCLLTAGNDCDGRCVQPANAEVVR